MFCFKCGKQIEDGSAFCPYCGAAQTESGDAGTAAVSGNVGSAQSDRPIYNNTLAIVGLVFTFLIPLVGVVLDIIAACMRETSPGWRLASAICIFVGVAIWAASIALFLL